MHRYNAVYADIISYPLRGYEPPAEFSAWISAAGAETRMLRYNVIFDDIISYLPVFWRSCERIARKQGGPVPW